jgi:hypothetical protein
MNRKVWNNRRGMLFARELECSGKQSGAGRGASLAHQPKPVDAAEAEGIRSASAPLQTERN